MLLLSCSRGATQSTSSTISQPGLKLLLVEFVKPEANPNDNLMMRRAGLSNLPRIVLWFLFAYLVDSGCSWHFDLLWTCSLNSIYQSQIVVSLVRNLQKNVPLWGKQKLPKVHLKQFYCLVHWYDLQGSWRRQIPLKLSINMRRSIVLANTRLGITYVWQYTQDLKHWQRQKRTQECFPKSNLFPYDRLLLSLGDDLLKKKK